jgi:DNA mismatch repair protein MSH4
MFYSIESIIKRFVDVDDLLSLCVQIPRCDSIKSAESKITKIIHLKHTLELVQPLLEAIRDAESQLLMAYTMV